MTTTTAVSTTVELVYINGTRRAGAAGEEHSIINPASGKEIARGSLATLDDVEEAVAAARAAFPGWSTTSPAERSEIMLRWADLLESRAEELASLESSNGGKPIKIATRFETPVSSTTCASLLLQLATSRAKHRRSTLRITPRLSAAKQSALLAPLRHGTTHCKWLPGRSCQL